MPPDSPEKPALQKDSLMGELESIKNLLNKDKKPDIPILEDSLALTSKPADSKESAFNLESIFEESLQAPMLPAADSGEAITSTREAPVTTDSIAVPAQPSYTRPVQAKHQQQTDFSLEIMIQEIVDDAIPVIEARLRERLSQCAPYIIRQLAEKKSLP